MLTDTLPRRGLADLHTHMFHLYLYPYPSRHPELALRSAMEVLRALGFATTINGPGDVTFVNKYGIGLPEAYRALYACADACAALGQVATARSFVALPKEIFRQDMVTLQSTSTHLISSTAFQQC